MTAPTLPARRPNDPRGWLTFEAPLPDDLQDAEDSTQVADFNARNQYQVLTFQDRIHLRSLGIRPVKRTRLRLATLTERTLLEALGFDLPEQLWTRVQFLTGTLRRRTWPQLLHQAHQKGIT